MSKRRTKYVEPRARVKVEDERDYTSSRVKRERSYSPDRSRRDRKYSRSRSRSRGRRTRTRSRSRSRDNQRSDRGKIHRRERSISPFTLHFDRWTNYKTAETKLLEYANKAIQKYDMTPEEHPKYGDEWKKFWEMRYSQVKASGMNPDTHDYVTEWVPVWSKRCAELMSDEVSTRKAALLKKFRLDSDRIPIRSDFKREVAAKKQEENITMKAGNQPSSTSSSNMKQEQYDQQQGHNSTSGGTGPAGNQPSGGTGPAGNQPSAIVQEQGQGQSLFNTGIASIDSLMSRKFQPPAELSRPPQESQGVPADSFASINTFASKDVFKRGTKSKLLVCLRLLGAFSEFISDDITEQLSIIMSKAKALEKSFDGASKVLIEDEHIQQTFHLARIQLKSCEDEIDESMFGSFQNCIQNLDKILSTQGGEAEVEKSRMKQEYNTRNSAGAIDGDNGKQDISLAYAEQIAAKNEILFGKKLKPSELVFGKKIESQNEAINVADNVSVISGDASSLVGSIVQSGDKSDENRKSKEVDGLKNYRECQKFLSECISIVMLQTGHKTYTKHGLQNLLVELMKKLELSETDSKIGQMAKQYNQNYNNNKKLDVSLVPPNMDNLYFTSDELSCLLQNYDNLSNEERKCFDFYMVNLKMRGTTSMAETELLQVYSVKSKGKSQFTSVLHQEGDNDMIFKPVSFDYDSRPPRSFGKKRVDTLADGKRPKLAPWREHFMETSKPTEKHSREILRKKELDKQKDLERARERAKERERERQREREGKEDRRKRMVEDARKNIDKKIKGNVQDKKKDSRSHKDDKKEKARKEQDDSVECIDIDGDEEIVEAAPVVAQRNLDGSVNLNTKYKDTQLNQWVRKGEVDQPMFLELTGPGGELIFKCTVCGSQLYGVKNVQTHYNGKKHANKLKADQWVVFDPTVEKPRIISSNENTSEPATNGKAATDNGQSNDKTESTDSVKNDNNENPPEVSSTTNGNAPSNMQASNENAPVHAGPANENKQSESVASNENPPTKTNKSAPEDDDIVTLD